MTKNTSNSTIVGLVVAVAVLIGYNFIGAANWAPAGYVPPQNNVEAPLNVGSGIQTKSGDIAAIRFAAADSVWSNLYCNYDGTICKSFSSLSTSSGGGGGVTQLMGGAGITLSPTTITGTGTININQSYTQRRISGTCPLGQAISNINIDGTVNCMSPGGIGYSQTWQNETFARTRNVWYQNTTGKPISVYIWVSPGDGFLYANTVGLDAGQVQIAGPDNDSGTRDNLFGIIPPGHWYKQTGRTHDAWSELR